MALPILQSTGGTSGAGTPGEGRNDIVSGENVDLSDTEAANSGATYLWSFLDQPPGSSISINNPTTATPDFDPVEAGGYQIRCTVNGTDTAEFILSVQFSELAGRVPVYNEKQGDYNAGGNLLGWHPGQYELFKSINSELVLAKARLVTLETNPMVDGKHFLAQAFTVGQVFSVTHTLGRDYKGFQCTNGLKVRELPVQTNKAVQIDLMVMGPELVERKVVTGSNVDLVTFSGLNGDADEDYTIIGHWRKATTSGVDSWLLMKPNGLTTNQRYSAMAVANGGSIETPGAATGMYIAWIDSVSSNNAVAKFRTEFRAKTGDRRAYRSQSGVMRLSNDNVWSGGGGWNDVATNVTSLVVQGSRTTDISVNSTFELWKSVPSKTTADVWVF